MVADGVVVGGVKPKKAGRAQGASSHAIAFHEGRAFLSFSSSASSIFSSCDHGFGSSGWQDSERDR